MFVTLLRAYRYSASRARRTNHKAFIISTVCLLTHTHILLCRENSHSRRKIPYEAFCVVGLSKLSRLRRCYAHKLAKPSDIALEWIDEIGWLQYIILSPTLASRDLADRWRVALAVSSPPLQWPSLPAVVVTPVFPHVYTAKFILVHDICDSIHVSKSRL